MTPVEAQTLRRENEYLKRRCAQLQSDVDDLGSEVIRLNQERERLGMVRSLKSAADPLADGQ